ncbi:Hypothetical protein I595_2268 [Croceitalea dokdonensis DOKDO 023]|uniref:DUF5916 domain-containing protein n=1 Tax=Croceitalea dokdonensis DOKDO 023 TaxID=1300341 RepID=A0A0P7AV35_9FLAO|nr:DUF5916 domain-containing protein [Croceitalea dokdonensis]KPM31773.1 Hypothetical protein I595_2268 [Croceitalea dokdonensis DOKDO 023]
MASRLLALIVFLTVTQLKAQETKKSFTVKYIEETITLDGALDEPIWEFAESANTFQQYFPSDSIPATQTTIIKMLYDDKNLYIGLRMNALGKDYIIPSLERDFRAGGNDNISLMFDTFNDGTNAFLFGMNPYGVRREALILNGGDGNGSFTTSWDVKWKGESKIYDKYYTAEMIIPLTSFKFREGETKWRFNSYRFDMQANERSTWIKIPQNQVIFNLAFMGDMVFEKPLGKSRTPLALIPYVNTLSAKDFETGESINTLKVGGDAKVAIGNGMNLDITVNPDFSQVEVDNFITNLTRFEIGLPERRQFFIDNNDLFGNFGGGRDANPFFSRRIGIARDTAGNTIENRILAGVRLSGKINNNLRLGFLNIQTEEDAENGIASNNNMMFSLQQKVFARSNISAFFINRQSFNAPDFLDSSEAYNRVMGIDYNLASADNTWIGKFYAHKSFQPDDNEGNYSLGAFAGYNSRFYGAFLDLVYIDEEFTSDLGFIPRKDIFKSAMSLSRTFWPKDSKINNHGFQAFGVYTWRPGLDMRQTDHQINIGWGAEFTSLDELSIGYSNDFIFLTEPFDPTGTAGAAELPANVGYYFNSFGAEFRSDRRKIFSYSLEPTIGQFFNGERYSMEASANLRIQPRFNFGFDVRFDRIQLPQPFASADIWLLSPNFDVTFSKSIFWSTLVQYSNQRDNLGINSRLQWRFAPLSDLFVVYNDNYFVNSFAPRSRSINLKLTYWLNI